jgi:hypothetical protein
MRFLFSKVNDYLFISDFILPKEKVGQAHFSLYFANARCLACHNLNFT